MGLNKRDWQINGAALAEADSHVLPGTPKRPRESRGKPSRCTKGAAQP